MVDGDELSSDFRDVLIGQQGDGLDRLFQVWFDVSELAEIRVKGLSHLPNGEEVHHGRVRGAEWELFPQVICGCHLERGTRRVREDDGVEFDSAITCD